MADCIRIEANGKRATRGAVQLNFLQPGFLEKLTGNFKM